MHSDRPIKLCFVGGPATGKSALFHALFGDHWTEEEKQVRDNGARWGVSTNFKIGDLPGYGVVGGRGDEEQALSAVRESDVVILVLPATVPPSEVARGLYDHVTRMRKPLVIAVNKSDLGEEPERAEVLEQVRLRFDSGETLIVAVSAATAQNLDELGSAIYHKLEEGRRTPFIRGVQNAAAKSALVNRLIAGSVITAGGIGLLNPFSDFLFLCSLQVMLVARIASVYGFDLSLTQARHFLTATGLVGGAGLGFRQIFRQIVRFVPVGGKFIAAAIAASGTMTIGLAAKRYFASSLEITPLEAAQQATRRRPRWLAWLNPEADRKEQEQAALKVIEAAEEDEAREGRPRDLELTAEEGEASQVTEAEAEEGRGEEGRPRDLELTPAEEEAVPEVIEATEEDDPAEEGRPRDIELTPEERAAEEDPNPAPPPRPSPPPRRPRSRGPGRT
jgi:small GTP-binding protein